MQLQCFAETIPCRVCSGAGLGSSDELRLIEDLFVRKAYNPLIRPVRNLTGTVHVKFGMAMIQLINVVSIHCVSKRTLSIFCYKFTPVSGHKRMFKIV